MERCPERTAEGKKAGYRRTHASQVIVKIKGNKGHICLSMVLAPRTWSIKLAVIIINVKAFCHPPVLLSNIITWVPTKQDNVCDCALTVNQRDRPVRSLLPSFWYSSESYHGQGWSWTWDPLVSCGFWYFLMWSWSKRKAQHCPLWLRQFQAWMKGYSLQ